MAVACPVPGRGGVGPQLSGRMKILLAPDSLAFRVWGLEQIEEEFNCGYELNPVFETVLQSRGLRVAGTGERNEARIVELSSHRFFIATLFQPQLASAPGAPHPLIVAYLEAALAFGRERI